MFNHFYLDKDSCSLRITDMKNPTTITATPIHTKLMNGFMLALTYKTSCFSPICSSTTSAIFERVISTLSAVRFANLILISNSSYAKDVNSIFPLICFRNNSISSTLPSFSMEYLPFWMLCCFPN